MRALLRRLFSRCSYHCGIRNGLAIERDKYFLEVQRLKKENAKLFLRAYDGDVLLSREIDNLNRENDEINHFRATLAFDNEVLRKQVKELSEVAAELGAASQAKGAELDASKKRNEELQEVYERLHWDFMSSKSMHEAADNECLRLWGRVGSLRWELDAVVATANETNAELDELGKLYNNAVDSWSLDHVELSMSREYTKRLADEKERLRLKALDLEGEVAKYVDAYRVATHALDVANEKKDNLSAALRDLYESAVVKWNVTKPPTKASQKRIDDTLNLSIAQACYYLNLSNDKGSK